MDAARAKAIATNDDSAAAEAEMLRAERDKAAAEVRYYQYQIDKAQVRAPISGLILKGDLEDKLHAPVKQGDVLMEIGNPNNLRGELSVEDRDIQDIHVGQT